MKKLFLLAISNIRGEKGQTISFFAIMTIAILLFNLGIMTMLNFGKTLDNDAIRLNSEKASLLITETENTDNIIELAKKIDGVTQFEASDVLCTSVAFDYSTGEMTSVGQFMKISDEREIGKVDIVEELETLPDASENERLIYMPYIVKTGGGYKLGDTIDITILEKTLTYKIAGFFENTFSNTVNAFSLGLLVNDAEYEELIDTFGASIKGKYIKLLISDDADSAKISTELAEMAKKEAPNADIVVTKNWEGMKFARSFTAQMCSAVLISLAVIILIISLVVIRFRVQNSIEENMQNIGAMKSLGYVSRQIIVGNIIQFLLVSTVSLVFGIALSYLILPLLSGVYAMQTGIIWNQGFDINSTLISLGIILGATILCTLISSRKIRKLNPIIALRGGLVNHSFKKNYLPLEKTHGNIHFLLAMKTALQSLKQNILVMLIMIATTLCALTSFTMFLRISLNPDDFVSTLCGEVSDIVYTVKNPDDIEKSMEEVKKIDGIISTFEYQINNVNVDGYTLYAWITRDFSNAHTSMCYDGRNPAHENEIAVNGSFANKINKKIGDQIVVTNGNCSESYIITGFVQSSNHYGMDAELTYDGIKRIDSNFKFSQVYAYTSLNVSDTIENIKNVDIEFTEVLDMRARIESQLNTYMSINNIMMVTIQAVVLLIILLTFYLVIKTTIIRRRRDLGIQKAIGYSTKQLAFQLVTSFTPVVIIGCALGGLLSFLLTNKIFGAIFGSLGIMRLEFTPPIEAILIFCFGICIVTYLISIVVSIRIRKISAYKLINEV